MADTPYVFDKENFGGSANAMKIMFPGDVFDDQGYIAATDTGIFIAASKQQVLNITDKFGVHMTGVLSLSATPDQIYIAGGYWTLNPLLLTCIPSTSATPIPTLVASTPPLLASSDDLSSSLSDLEGGLV
jgi:hypothetical protein